jgi:hypothetical protein
MTKDISFDAHVFSNATLQMSLKGLHRISHTEASDSSINVLLDADFLDSTVMSCS